MSNYRGITLLSVFGKLFTRVLNNRLNKWAEDYNVYIKAQGGFRKGYGTTDSIFVLHNLITWCINNKKTLYCTFIDYRKAFDYVVHKNLWYKLLNIGIRGKMLTIIQNMYSSVKSCVRGPEGLTCDFDCILGVRQGESLSPFLFAMYVNDLETTLNTSGITGLNINMLKLFILFYADDAVLLSESREDLQNGLNTLSAYCDRWKLVLNTDKTKIVIFRAGGRLGRVDKWHYKGIELQVVTHFTYLGLVFSQNGTFSRAQQTLAKQAQKAIFSLYRMVKRFTGLNPFIMCDLFDKMILPILTYGCEVWGYHNGDAVEKVHREFLKGLLKVKSTTVNEFVYGEFGRKPLVCGRYVRIVKYWFKLLKQPNNRLTKQIYDIQKSYIDIHDDKANWASLLRDMLFNLGFGEVWYNQGVEEEERFLQVFKQRITDNYMQVWKQKIGNTRKSLLYRRFHDIFSPCQYLQHIKNVKHRIALTHLRTRNNRLFVETGSWGNQSTPYEQRYCTHCNTHDIEDEYHFLLICPLYTELRQKYVPKYYRCRPSVYKFVQLMQTEKNSLLSKLGAFSFHAFNLRNQTMYIR